MKIMPSLSMVSLEIVIAEGSRPNNDTMKFIHSIYKRFIPNKVVAVCPYSQKELNSVVGIIPFVKEQLPINNKTTVYVCENYICKLPITDIKKMEELQTE